VGPGLSFRGNSLLMAIIIIIRIGSKPPVQCRSAERNSRLMGGRLVGLLQFITGIWLMYCTYAMTVDLALGAKAWV